jgi:hypothetical protein
MALHLVCRPTGGYRYCAAPIRVGLQERFGSRDSEPAGIWCFGLRIAIEGKEALDEIIAPESLIDVASLDGELYMPASGSDPEKVVAIDEMSCFLTGKDFDRENILYEGAFHQAVIDAASNTLIPNVKIPSPNRRLRVPHPCCHAVRNTRNSYSGHYRVPQQ